MKKIIEKYPGIELFVMAIFFAFFGSLFLFVLHAFIQADMWCSYI